MEAAIELHEKKDSMSVVHDLENRQTGIWHEDIYVPISESDMTIPLVEWRKQRIEAIEQWLTERDSTYAHIYSCALAQYPQLEGCDIRLPADREEEQKVLYGLGYFSVMKPHVAVVRDFDSHDGTAQFVHTHKEYIRLLSAQLGIAVSTLRNEPRFVSYYSFLHELGHAQHFFSAYFTSKTTCLYQAQSVFTKDYDQALDGTLRYARRNTRESWSSLYWNMPFEREANDFAVELYRSAFVYGSSIR